IKTAYSDVIVHSLNISTWLDSMILKFTKLFVGYATREQLFDVYGFDSADVKKRWDFIRIDTGHITKIQLNESTFRSLLRHPYLTYDIVKQIVSLREDTTIHASLLLKRQILTPEEFKKLRPYLSP
ncbi:MAG: hypothetical protein P8100_12175, partial [bacterium]